MAIKTYNDQNFVAIANAIRAKNGETTQYKPSEMAPAIMAIESGLELLPQDTVSGAIANFPDGSNNYPVVELIANIKYNQEFPYDECRVTRTGKNIFPYPISDFWDTGDISDSTGEDVDNANYTRLKGYIPIPSGVTSLILSGVTNSGTSDKFRFFLYGENKTFLSYVNSTSSVSISSSVKFIRIRYQTETATFNNPQLEYGSAPTDYEQYQKETKTIYLGRTVYGGSLNVTTGELTVNYGIVDLGSLTWTRYTGGANPIFTSSDVEGMKVTAANQGVTLYCSNYDPYNTARSRSALSNLMDNYRSSALADYTRIVIRDDDYTNADTFKAALDGVMLAYPLATPEVYQVDPEIVKTLLGVNNIYADTGDVEVTYRADIDLYIAKKIAEGA